MPTFKHKVPPTLTSSQCSFVTLTRFLHNIHNRKPKVTKKKHSLAKAVTSLDSKDFEDIYQRTYG